ncbi:MAG: alkaline phosphatase D family protein [Thermoanaerobaculia bacterium]
MRRTILAVAVVLASLNAGPPKAEEKPVSRIAFGSCLGQDLPQPIWARVLAARPDLFVFLGDNVYADTDDPTLLRAAYAKLASQPGFQRLKRTVPILATWDDHDYGTNDSGGDFPAKEASRQVFLDFFGVAKDSPRRKLQGVYHAETFGPPGKRVQIIALDTRYNRSALVFQEDPSDPSEGGSYVPSSDPAATLLGAEQWAWLEEVLREPAQIRIIGSSILVVNETYPGEKWANFPLERKRLFELLWKNRVTGAIFISGDRHLAELSMMDGDFGYPAYDLTSSSLNWGERRWRHIESNRHRIGLVSRGDNFGLIEIDWDRADPLIRLKVIDVDGDLVLHHKVDLSTLREGNLEWWLGEK